MIYKNLGESNMISKLDQYIINRIHVYPSLYSGKSYTESKIRVLDQLLNVIGNGIRDNEELTEEMGYINDALTMKDVERYVTGEQLFYGYTRIKEFQNGDKTFSFEDFSSSIDETVLDNDRYKYPDVIKWVKCTYYPFNPYPNFQEEYSTIYQCPAYLDLDESFISGAVEYYEFVKNWFNKHESEYHYSFPQSTKEKTERTIKDMEDILDKYETYEDVEKAYGVKYNGDVYEFLVTRWKKEKKRIFKFIDETLELLRKIEK